MAKRYHSSPIEETSGFCHLPTEVIVKEISNEGSFNGGVVADTYRLVEKQMAEERAALTKLCSPKKF
jgi:hypothetical protein